MKSKTTEDNVRGVVLMDVKQAAARLGVTPGRVRQLAAGGQLKAVKIGRDWVFIAQDVEDFAARVRRPGRPTYQIEP